jgi:hypothetical protein
MRALIFSLFCALFCFTTQDGFAACNLCVCVTDNTCSDVVCDVDGSCVSTQFTAPCTGTYTVKSKVTCPNSAMCKDCIGCAIVIRNHDGGIMGSIHGPCQTDSCNSQTTVTLSQNTVYRLYACMGHCADDDCDDCEGCSVYAVLYRITDDCLFTGCTP